MASCHMQCLLDASRNETDPITQMMGIRGTGQFKHLDTLIYVEFRTASTEPRETAGVRRSRRCGMRHRKLDRSAG